VTGTTTETVAEAAATAAVDPATVLSVEGFDADAALALVSGSDGLSDISRAALSAAVEQARNDPALVGEVVTRLRAALGL